MSDKDELTNQDPGLPDGIADRFHEMKQYMEPSPDLMARLEASLADDAAPVSSDPAHVSSAPTDRHTPAAKPDSHRPINRPKARGKRGLGVLTGGLTAAVLSAVMLVGQTPFTHTSTTDSGPWAPWPDPVTVTGPMGQSSAGENVPSVDPGLYADIYKALVSTSQGLGTSGMAVTDMAGGAVTNGAAPTAGRMEAGPTSAAADYSATNVQVTGIDEADFVKTDGSYIYIATGRTVSVVTADGAGSHQVAAIDISGVMGAGEILAGPVVDMFIDGTTLVIFTHGFSPDVDDWSRSSGQWISMQATTVKAVFYDISDPANPTYLSVISQSGAYADSRLSDGILYVVSQYSVSPQDADPGKPVTYVPSIDTGTGKIVVDPGCIEIMPGASSPTYSLVTAINVAQRTVTSEQAVLGRSDTVYMSSDNLYLASAQWPMYSYTGDLVRSEPVSIPEFANFQGTSTDIVRIGLHDGHLSLDATANLPGTLVNQFALDELDGYLRVATTRQDNNNNDWRSIPGLWVLDSSLDLVGSISDLSTSESVQSVRFDGTIGYVVTFERIDPLFAIDLSDPKNPEVKSVLKIPGFSTYLHPFGDGLLLGVGIDTDETGVQTGLKLSMFDISDPYDVSEVTTTHLDAGDTEVSQDHKAAFVDVENGLIGFPAVTWAWQLQKQSQTTTDEVDYNWLTWEYHIYSWDGSAFTRQKDITIFSGDYNTASSLLQDTSTRGIRVGQDFYLVTSSSVEVYNMNGYAQIADVPLR